MTYTFKLSRRLALLAASVALAGTVAWACSKAGAESRPRPTAPKAVAFTKLQAAADSFKYRVSWAKPVITDAQGPIDGYRLTITLDRSGLVATPPSNKVVTDTSFVLAGLLPAPGDSALITAKVWSERRGVKSLTAAAATKRVLGPAIAPPPPPGSVIIGLVVYPQRVTIDTGKTQQFCPFAKMGDNTLAMVNPTAGIAYCRQIYDTLPGHRTTYTPVKVRLGQRLPPVIIQARVVPGGQELTAPTYLTVND